MFFITIEQVKYFLALNTYKSFSLASEELCISQSSLSKQIKALENELNILLFNRTTRSISLTEAGKEFLIHCNKLIKDYDNTINSMKKYSLERKSTLNIGTIPVISQYGIISSIAVFKNLNPNININVIEGERIDILNMLDKGDINFAFLRDFHMDEDKFQINPLIEDELILITPKNHKFANKKYISLDNAKDEKFIMLSSTSGIDKFCIEECEKYGFTPNIVYRINKIETILGLVGEGFGISLLMKRVISPFNKENISINLLKKQSTNSLSIVYKKDKKLSHNEVLFKEFIENSKG